MTARRTGPVVAQWLTIARFVHGSAPSELESERQAAIRVAADEIFGRYHWEKVKDTDYYVFYIDGCKSTNKFPLPDATTGPAVFRVVGLIRVDRKRRDVEITGTASAIPDVSDKAALLPAPFAYNLALATDPARARMLFDTLVPLFVHAFLDPAQRWVLSILWPAEQDGDPDGGRALMCEHDDVMRWTVAQRYSPVRDLAATFASDAHMTRVLEGLREETKRRGSVGVPLARKQTTSQVHGVIAVDVLLS